MSWFQILFMCYLSGLVIGVILFFNCVSPNEADNRTVSKWVTAVSLHPIVFPVLAIKFLYGGVIALVQDIFGERQK